MEESRILKDGSAEEKITVLERLESTIEPEILNDIISRLDDADIRVRGEAFSSLVLNSNEISGFLIENLNSASKNIRGFLLLVLANRCESSAIPDIARLAEDQSSMVRACAIGALNHLQAKNVEKIFLKATHDQSNEVRKSAIQGIIDRGIPVSIKQIDEIAVEDDEAKRLILHLREQWTGRDLNP